MGSILVLGLGNVLQGDDGVGVHIVRWLAGQAPMTGVTVLDGGTDMTSTDMQFPHASARPLCCPITWSRTNER